MTAMVFEHGEVLFRQRVVSGRLPIGWFTEVERVVVEVRRRTAGSWWERVLDIEEASGPFVPQWAGAADLLDYLGGAVDVAVLPADVVAEVGVEMYEAAREAGLAVLADFCRRLAPVLVAIEAIR